MLNFFTIACIKSGLASSIFHISIFLVVVFVLREIFGHSEGNVYAAAFTPCDNFLITGSGLGDLRVWEIPSMQVKNLLQKVIIFFYCSRIFFKLFDFYTLMHTYLKKFGILFFSKELVIC